MGGALHIRRRYRALFLVVQNFHNRTENKNKCRGNSTGCCIYSPECAARANYVLTSTLDGCLYTPTRVFLCLFFSGAVEGLERRTGRCKHLRFLYVVDKGVIINLTFGCLSEQKNRARKNVNGGLALVHTILPDLNILDKIEKQLDVDVKELLNSTEKE